MLSEKSILVPRIWIPIPIEKILTVVLTAKYPIKENKVLNKFFIVPMYFDKKEEAYRSNTIAKSHQIGVNLCQNIMRNFSDHPSSYKMITCIRIFMMRLNSSSRLLNIKKYFKEIISHRITSSWTNVLGFGILFVAFDSIDAGSTKEDNCLKLWDNALR